MRESDPKVVVLTGATRGLGLAMTERLTGRGETVSGCGHSRTRVQALRKQFGPPHTFAVVDVASDAQVKVWARKVLSDYGPPDFLINNAALAIEPAALWEVSDGQFAQLLDVNIRGVANTIRYFVPAMLQRKRGVIVNFSSGWGRSTSPYVAAYCATKWAIEGLTQALAQELPPSMAAVAYSPGIVNTDMLRTCFGEDAHNYPDPGSWARRAVPALLKLGPRQNGQSVSAPSL